MIQLSFSSCSRRSLSRSLGARGPEAAAERFVLESAFVDDATAELDGLEIIVYIAHADVRKCETRRITPYLRTPGRCLLLLHYKLGHRILT